MLSSCLGQQVSTDSCQFQLVQSLFCSCVGIDVRGTEVKWVKNIHPFTVLFKFSYLTCKLRYSSNYACPWSSYFMFVSIPEFHCTSELHPLRRMRLGLDRIGIFQKSLSITWTLQEILDFLIPYYWFNQFVIRIVWRSELSQFTCVNRLWDFWSLKRFLNELLLRHLKWYFHLFLSWLKKQVVPHCTIMWLVIDLRRDFFLIQFEDGDFNLNCYLGLKATLHDDNIIFTKLDDFQTRFWSVLLILLFSFASSISLIED